MADQLVTLAAAKLRLVVTDATDDTLITDLIEQVSGFVQDRCRRRFLPDDAATYIVDTGPGSEIQVPRGVRTVTTLEVAQLDQPDTGGSYTAVDAADVLLRPSPMFLRPGWPPDTILIRGAAARLRAALNGAKITGNFDFAATPQAIEGVVMDAVVVAYNARQGGSSDGVGEGNVPLPVWAEYFTDESPQGRTLARYTAGTKVGIG